MVRVIYFGDKKGESIKILSSIEFAIDVYRKNLTSFMKDIGSALERTILVDKCTDKFVKFHNLYRIKLSAIPSFYEMNEILLQDLTQSNVSLTYAILSTVDCDRFMNQTTIKSFDEVNGGKLSSYDSMEQLIVHLNRDWGKGGEIVRKTLYKNGILQSLLDFKTLLSESKLELHRVLVPGSGLGRLAVEIALAGFSVEMNECSGAMMNTFHNLTANFIPNQLSRIFYPHISFAMKDEWKFADRFIEMSIPNYDDSPEIFNFFSEIGDGQTSLSFQFGDFVSVYGSIDHACTVDVVLTCFFMDTAPDIFEYLSVIKNVLKPGGLWINTGPLHYHQRGAIPYSHDDLLTVFKLSGFLLLDERKITTSYCGDESVSMKPEVYVIPLNVFQMNYDENDIIVSDEMNGKSFETVDYILK